MEAKPPAAVPSGIAGFQCTKVLRSHLSYKRLWTEASGALGDLGTFVPITIALTLVNGLDLGTTLIFTGLYNIITGLLFGVPMPVQPMKAIAAVAVTQGNPLSIPQIMAAGITTAGVLFVLGTTRLMSFVQRILPLSVVRGIQLAQGLSFAETAVKYVLKKQNFAQDKSVGNRPWLGLDGLVLALVCFGFIVLVTGSGDSLLSAHCTNGGHKRRSNEDEATDDLERSEATQERISPPKRERSEFRRRLETIPSAMVVFVLGIVLTFVRKPSIGKGLRLGPSHPHVVHISKRDWRTGFVRAALPQIPLSLLNSVVAVCKLSTDLYPEKQFVTPAAVATSVGIMNLVGCWFGAMPVCHGAGGLAGQWRFGASSGLAVVMLGLFKLLLGVLLGSSLATVLEGYPVGVLGVLLFYAGVELAMAARDQTSREGSMVVLGCAAVSLATSNAAVGFVFSLVLQIMLVLPEQTWASIKEWVVVQFSLKRS